MSNIIMRRENRLVVLAGGLGTRLRSIVSDVPKPMAPIHGIPFLQYLLEYWLGQGIQEIILSVGYRSEKIQNYFGNNFCGVPLKYVFEVTPLGTGGAVKNSLSTLNLDFKNTFIINGDTWFEVNLTNFIETTKSLNYPVKMVLKQIDNNNRYDGVGLDSSGIINQFGIKNSKETLINGGCYWVDQNFLSNYLKSYSGKFSFEEDVLRQLANEKLLYGYIQDGQFCDIGIPEDYQKIGSIIVE
jgi:D-glycero-alpha-D-manno-heptose 1-phosphate guanylyltransferase